MTALNLDAPFQEQRLAAIMGGEDSPAFKAFMDAVKTEGRMAQTRGIVAGGSQTAAFQRDIARSGVGFDEVVDLLMNPSSITNVGTLTRLFQGTINSIKGTGGDVGQQVARRLLTTDPQDQMRILKEIQDRRAQMENTRRVVSRMGLGAAGAASQLPSLLDVGE
jgi:peptide methionine sulfoxide reductase MsrA